MVVFVDFEEEEAEIGRRRWGTARNGPGHGEVEGGGEVGRNLSWELIRSGMSEALGCYPIITQIATHLDLNSLSHLSATCRLIRATLLPFRRQLLAHSLRCIHDVPASHPPLVPSPRPCARDLVGACRRPSCGAIVCRNCTYKPPAPALLPQRLRRLCSRCTSAAAKEAMMPEEQEGKAPSWRRALRSASFCTCATDGVWLCRECGRGLRAADATYEAIWRWRARYSALLGGIGTGIGEGDRGVECGRGKGCAAAREVESETDCDAADARSDRGTLPATAAEKEGEGGTAQYGVGAGGVSHQQQQQQMGPGYRRHEIEGIGGNIKRKLVTMVRVGACVRECEEELACGKWLLRETEGKDGAWCGWCRRLVRGAGVEEGL